MSKRQKAKYLKELNEIQNKHFKLMENRLSFYFQKFANEVFELNSKYFEMVKE